MNDKLLKCKICGKEVKMLSMHISKSHKISKDEYEDKFGPTKFVLDEITKRRSEILSERNKENWKDKDYRNKMESVLTSNGLDPKNIKRMKHLGSITNNWDNQEYREKYSKKHSESLSERNKENWKSEEYKSKMSEVSRHTMTNLWKSEEFRNLVSDTARQTMTSNWNDINFSNRMRELSKNTMSSTMNRLWSDEYAKMYDIVLGSCLDNSKVYKRYKHNGYSFRSSWELLVAKTLDNEGILYEYESYRFEYIGVDNHTHYYYPDFYLPSLDLFLEIHPSSLMDQTMKLKLNSLPNILLLTESELFSDNLINHILNFKSMDDKQPSI